MADSESSSMATAVGQRTQGKPTSAPDEPPTVAARRTQSERQSQLALRDTVITILLSAVIFVGLHTSFLVLPLDGPSMQPGLHTDERVLVNSLTYDFSAPQRGDVVVFHPPAQPALIYIKRVIGLPGDTISLTLNTIYVDGVLLDEPYVPVAPPGVWENPEVVTVHLGPGQYFLLGDNRSDSRDSRYFGPVPRGNIIGQAQYVIWPSSSFSSIPTYRGVYANVKQ